MVDLVLCSGNTKKRTQSDTTVLRNPYELTKKNTLEGVFTTHQFDVTYVCLQ